MATTKRPRTKKSAEVSETKAPKETAAKKPASVPKQIATVTTRTVDLQEAIRVRAYGYFQQRGYQHGADIEDWVRAEREVLDRFDAA